MRRVRRREWSSQAEVQERGADGCTVRATCLGPASRRSVSEHCVPHPLADIVDPLDHDADFPSACATSQEISWRGCVSGC